MDIHLDTGPSTEALGVLPACDLAERYGWGRRTAIGHGCGYANLPPQRLAGLRYGSLLRIANLYAKVIQRGTAEELAECFEMLTSRPARIQRWTDHGVAGGNTADLTV